MAEGSVFTARRDHLPTLVNQSVPWGVAYKMIKVDDQTHARLVRLAQEQGVTIGGLVGELASSQPTKADRDQFLAAVQARFGRPDAEALARVNALLDRPAADQGDQPVACT